MTGIFNNLAQFLIAGIRQAQAISPILAAAAAVIFGLMYAFGGQQAAQTAKSRGVQMIAGCLVVWLVAIFVNTLISLAGAGGTVDNISLTAVPFLRFLMQFT